MYYLPRRRRDAFDHTAPLWLCVRRTLDVREEHGANYKHQMLLLPKRRVIRLDRVSDIGANLPNDDQADYYGLVCRRPRRVHSRIRHDFIGERYRHVVSVFTSTV